MKQKSNLAIREEVIEPTDNLADLFKTAKETIQKCGNDGNEILEGARAEIKLLKQILLELKKINRKLNK